MVKKARKKVRKRGVLVYPDPRSSVTKPQETFTPRQWLAVFFGPLLLAIMFLIWTKWSARVDLTDTEERHGIGRVSDIQTLGGARRQSNLMLSIEMNGKTSLFRPYAWDENTILDIKSGTQVNVDYRVGKSGNIYIDRVVPAGSMGKENTITKGL